MSTLRRRFTNSDELCQYMRELTGDTCLLAFSRGKDAIGAWLQLRRYFKRIIPFYMYMAPRMRFVEEGLAYYQEVFGAHIHQYPHPSLYRWLDARVFQSPRRAWELDGVRLYWNLGYGDVAHDLRKRYGLSGAYVATGVRAADSPLRGMSIRKHGAVNHGRQSFFPVYDWNLDRLLQEIGDAGVKLPVDYWLWGRTLDGIDYRFMVRLRKWYPDDYQKLLDLFPLLELDILRRKAAGVDIDKDAEGQAL